MREVASALVVLVVLMRACVADIGQRAPLPATFGWGRITEQGITVQTLGHDFHVPMARGRSLHPSIDFLPLRGRGFALHDRDSRYMFIAEHDGALRIIRTPEARVRRATEGASECTVRIIATDRLCNSVGSSSQCRTMLGGIVRFADNLIGADVAPYGVPPLTGLTVHTPYSTISQALTAASSTLDEGPEPCLTVLFDTRAYGSILGMANIGDVCSPTANGAVVACDDNACFLLVTAHEIGHQFGAEHVHDGSVMEAYIDDIDDDVHFSAINVARMRAVMEDATCLLTPEEVDGLVSNEPVPRNPGGGGGGGGTSAAVIAGAVVGACAGVAIIVALVWWATRGGGTRSGYAQLP